MENLREMLEKRRILAPLRLQLFAEPGEGEGGKGDGEGGGDCPAILGRRLVAPVAGEMNARGVEVSWDGMNIQL